MNHYAAMYLVVGDEFCLRESCEALVKEGVEMFFFLFPLHYWNGEQVPKGKRDEVRAIMKDLPKKRMVEVIPPGSKPLAEQEAIVRNYCMTQMVMAGYKGALIVDGDEIWQPGTLAAIDVVVNDKHPAVSIPSLNIVGFPGYPVVGNQEGLLVYARSDNKFVYGRSTEKGPAFTDCPSLIHFTSTRRTMEETILKHRLSCHYRESDYDFEGWLKDVLPRIKPGAKISHMFKRWNVWKEVRYFTHEEWDLIPQRLHAYLGGPPDVSA